MRSDNGHGVLVGVVVVGIAVAVAVATVRCLSLGRECHDDRLRSVCVWVNGVDKSSLYASAFSLTERVFSPQCLQ